MRVLNFSKENFAWAALVGVAVYLLALLGITLQREAAYISSLWPANAVAIAMLLRRTNRDWLVGFVGVAAGNLALNITIGSPFWLAIGYASINVFEVAIGFFLVSRCLGRPTVLNGLRPIGLFGLCAGLLVPAITAFPGAGLGSILYGAEFWPAWRVWWMADSISVMIFAPLVLSAGDGFAQLRADGRRAVEFLGLTALTLAVTGLTFSSDMFPLAYLTFPFLVAAGVRFGIFGVGFNASVLSLTAVWLTIIGGGHTPDLATAIVEVQVFLGVTVLAALSVAAVMVENRATIDKLEASEGRFRDLVEHASDAIFVHDLEGNFVDANFQACQSLGYARDELLALNVRDVEATALAKDTDDAVWPRLREGKAVTVNGNHRRKDGTEFPVEVRLGLLAYDSKPMIVAMARDVTERRQAEIQLRKAKEVAEEANRAKSVFLANTSHELRTPLNAVIGYSELLEDETAANGHTEYAEDLGRIKAAGRHLLDIITGILDLSKVEAGKMEVDIVPLKLADLIEQVGAAVEPLARRNGNSLSVDCDPAIGEIESDPVKLRQILINLLSNAVKFTSGGEIALRADAVTEDGGAWLKIGVRDTGIGIAADQFDSLFEAFTQADSSTTRRFGGTGLGLAISRRYCELLGGRIEVESRQGEGAVFTVSLPMARDRGARAAE